VRVQLRGQLRGKCSIIRVDDELRRDQVRLAESGHMRRDGLRGARAAGPRGNRRQHEDEGDVGLDPARLGLMMVSESNGDGVQE
jgi:hypothetical protein